MNAAVGVAVDVEAGCVGSYVPFLVWSREGKAEGGGGGGLGV